MRNTFAKTLVELARRDPRVVMLSGDIGNRLFDDFRKEFPTRFYNVGIAEANMIGMAAGLAMTGLRPIAYTITPFVTTRCLEQIRVDLCYHQQNVILAGVGSGLGYAELGATHQACEDIAMLRCLPHMTVVCPADCIELKLAMAAALEQPGPLYLRLGKKGEPDVHAAAPQFKIGKGIILRDGPDLCILATGHIMPIALEAADLLAQQNLRARVVSLHTVKPLDHDLLAQVFAQYPLVASVEEHSLIGGLGGALAEWLADQSCQTDLPLSARLLRIGTDDRFPHEAGHQNHARKLMGLTATGIAQRIARTHSLLLSGKTRS